MSKYRVSIDKHGESAIRLPKEADSTDDVQIVRHVVTGWRAVFYIESRNQRDAISDARQKLRAVSEPVFWHLTSRGAIEAEAQP